MKKKLLGAIALCTVVVFLLCGCQAGLVSTNISVNADGSGVKTITVMIYGDAASRAGTEENEEPNLVGNNSKYLLLSGDDLAAKIQSYSALEGLEITSSVDGEYTTLTIRYSFSSIEDYTAKTKKLAKDNADKIEVPTFTQNADGTFTYKENTENTVNSIDNLFLSLYNDPEAFSKDGQGECDLESFGYNYTCIYTVMSVSATVGEETTTIQINQYDTEGNPVEQDWADYIEVTGKAAAAEPAPTEGATSKDPAAPTQPADSAQPSGLSTGAIIGIVVAVIAVAAVVVVVIVFKKKKS